MDRNLGRILVSHVSAMACFLMIVAAVSAAEETPATPPTPKEQVPADQVPPKAKSPVSKLVPLTKEKNLWIDPQRKLVVMEGEVCLREGQLEMFACPKGSKEHESLISVSCKPQHVHAALLAVGAVPGRPVQFDPVYAIATGTEIEILLLWIEKDGTKHKVRAQEWIKNVRTDKPMKYNWVFAGSGFWNDEQTGERLYYGDGGDFICVSNFATATLDVPIESSQANTALLFVANTEQIPPLRTPVRLVLIPKPPKEPAAKSSKPVAKEAALGESTEVSGP